MNNQKTNFSALGVLTIVFFFWGFIAAGNSIFIPFCKNYFHLDQFQSQLVDYAFYGAYYIGALILFITSSIGGRDLVGNWGYKKSIVYGLLFSAFGAAAMIVAVYGNTFSGMLIGFFLVALGFSLQQTAANPFAISLGNPATGATRVNFTGGINSFGTMIGPLIVAFALFGSSAAVTDDMIAELDLIKVIVLYMVVGILFILAAAIFGLSKSVPSGVHAEPVEAANRALRSLLIMTGLLIVMFTPVFSSYNSSKAKAVAKYETALSEIKKEQGESLTYTTISEKVKEMKKPLEQERMLWLSGALISVVGMLLFANRSAMKNPEGWGAMRYPQLVLGMLAIFIYVGVEVAIGSNLGELLKQKDFGGLEASAIAPYISMYWGSLMIGRWAGAVSAFDLQKSTKALLIVLVPIVAFCLILAANLLAQKDVSALYWYILCVGVQIAAFFYVGENPIKSLMVFGSLGVAAMLIGMFSTGQVAVYAFLSGGLFCSILWPCIFSLSIAGLGKFTSQGSAFLIMMILGGGIIPPIQGKLADLIGIQSSYVIAVLCFGYLVLFAALARKILKKQGVDLEGQVEIVNH
ncbi:MAG TPA: MFS transporter [Crocinitomicaceae bacterium]|nr:MFS transporter [Flavobacteriales bacterium]HBW86280.1 MFS transporter [Crocinitomicaceae bacterium]